MENLTDSEIFLLIDKLDADIQDLEEMRDNEISSEKIEVLKKIKIKLSNLLSFKI